MAGKDTERTLGRLEAVTEALMKTSENLTATVSSLPCSEHTERLGTLEDWKRNCNGEKRSARVEKVKGMISLKNAVIIALLTGVLGVGSVLLTNWLTYHVP